MEKAKRLIQLLSEGMLVARNLATNTHVAHRITELWQQWQENTLEFARSGPNLRDTAGIPLKTTYTFADLADLPPKLQEITWHRYQLIQPLIHLPSRQRTTQVVQERIQAYLSSLEQKKAQGAYTFLFGLRVGRGTSPTQRPSSPVPGSSGRVPDDDLPTKAASREAHVPSLASPLEANGDEALNADRPSAHQEPLLALTPRTVSRWLRRYLESQQDIRSLVPSYHQRGPRHSRLSPLLEALLQQAIKHTYLTNVRAPITHVITSFHELIIAENSRRSPEEQLPTPGKMTVYRYLHLLDDHVVVRARFGPATAARKQHQSQQGPLPTRPNQRVEFDFARLDLLVVDPADRLPIGRPTLAAIRDKYTGYPLAVLISFDPPSYRVVMECMLYAFLPKTHVQALFQTQHEYLAFGVPEVLVVDNAIELHRDLELACLQLGIELQHMPVRKPWFKGSIERWFRTLNTDLIHVTPGTTFSHFLERGEYDSQKHACITLDRLWELLHLWIVDVYTKAGP
jgi:putative transposase